MSKLLELTIDILNVLETDLQDPESCIDINNKIDKTLKRIDRKLKLIEAKERGMYLYIENK